MEENLTVPLENTDLLEQRIHSAVEDYDELHDPVPRPSEPSTMITRLHRLASLIYTNRAIHRLSGAEFRHKRLVREGLLLLSKLETCQSAWPLFIIACEAVDDESRVAILNAFERSLQDRRRRSNHVHFIQHLVEAVWNQRDLDTEGQVDYMLIFDAVIGGVPFTPPFA
jgi:hypothetical protein